ncbi:MAG TPA: hypothetical protein VNW97_10170 [Candidatus Saccharimonadales bacterium]|jgi:type IV pilus assembly protein PilA|nr:hypothetical protein [Candidatus Saccharimonadales bacterium]
MRQGSNTKLLTLFVDGCWLAVIVVLLMAAPAMAMQEKPADETMQDQVMPPAKPSPWEAELAKYPGLLPELGKALGRMIKAVEFPASRTQSRLLPMLSDSTVVFAAAPNYGNAAHQALQAFQQELKENEVLRNWWQHTELNSSKPGMEEALEKFYEFSQYLGDEIVISGDVGGKKNSGLLIAEVRKPGLKLFLQQLAQQFGGKAGAPWQLFDPQQLALAKGSGASSQPLVLVRPNLLAVSSDLATLRSFNATLGPAGGKLAASPFGQRLTQAYHGGAGLLFGVDLHKLIDRNPPASAKEQEGLQRSGFGDVKYLVWEHKNVPGEPPSQTELSFNGKRRGIASWLASPTKLGGLDFVAPDATLVLSIALKDPALIFDDLAELAGPGALDAITQPAEAFKINPRNDVLGQLTGEITLEIDGAFLPVPGEAQQEPLWKVMLGVRDAEGMQKTFDRLAEALGALAADGQGPSLKRHEAGRLSYYTLQIPSPQKATEINWTFSDGYMLVASTRARLTEAIRFHHDGESLVRSGSFHAVLPAGRSADASALFYQNTGSLLAPFMQRISPELANMVPGFGELLPAGITTVYADETSIRQVSGNAGLDVGVVLTMAAIAIPNLMRSRMEANETAARATVRTLVTSDIVYATSYPNKGYAADLASLGGSSADCSSPSEKHACLIDEGLGCASGKWCIRNGYRYHLAAICAKGPCSDFVAVATPVDSDKGLKNFCATSDGVVRYRLAPPLASPISLAECLKWEPL